jgi:hypothetical protein
MNYSTPFCFVAYKGTVQVKVWNYDGFNFNSYIQTKKAAIEYCVQYGFTLEEFGVSGIGCIVKF